MRDISGFANGMYGLSIERGWCEVCVAPVASRFVAVTALGFGFFGSVFTGLHSRGYLPAPLWGEVLPHTRKRASDFKPEGSYRC